MGRLFFICRALLFFSILALTRAPPASAFTTLPARTNDTPGFAYTPSPADWRAVPLYQVITDRFFDGDPANNDDNPDAEVNPFGSIAIHGGDFEGIARKLDYLQMLGVRGIWISPVVKNVNGIFHGYAAQDLNAIDPHWGTLQDLRDFIDAAHARGIYVIIDVVQNHMGDLLTSTDAGFPSFNSNGYNLHWRNASQTHAAPFNDIARFYNFGNIDNFGDTTQSLLGDFAGLDGIRTEDPQVRADLTTIYEALVAATDCDGFRVDTAKHVEMGFWETFLPALYDFTAQLGKTNFLVFAEVFDGSDSFVASFTATNRFNSVLEFPLRQTFEDVFVWDQPTSWITDRFDALGQYAASARDQLVSFLDNHDMPRYLSTDRLSGNTARLKVALTCLYTYLHVPCLYYGTEQGFDGGNDPFDREDMFDGEFEFGPSDGDNFDYTHELFRHVRLLTLLRKAYPPLETGLFQQRWQSFGGGGLYVFSRILGSNEVIVALNTASTTQTALNGTAGPGTTYPDGTVLANVLDPAETVLVGSGGGHSQITFSVPGHSQKIFVPTDAVMPLPPTVNTVLPVHEATEVPLASSVTIEFDRPMDTGAVEAAFGLDPAAPGTYAWENNFRRMVFSPGVPLLSNTAYRVLLDATAAATNGLALGARFESRFNTGLALVEQKPLGDFVLDGQLDAGVPLIAARNGMALYALYDATNGALYVATLDAGEGNDHFIFLDNDLSGPSRPVPHWNKNGNVASDGPFVADENDNDFVSWFDVSAAAAAKTGPNGGVMEGVINIPEHYGSTPAYIYLAVGVYPTADGGTLLADYQVPASQDFDQDIDTNEYVRLDLVTGEVLVPAPPAAPGEVPLTQYNLDGSLSAVEAASLQTGNGGLHLYADFNGKLLYVATEDAGEGSDHFIFVTPDVTVTSDAPWAKTGRVAGPNDFLADENDNDFEGWFINNGYDPARVAATPLINGGYMEGVLDVVDVFGTLPDTLYIAIAPYATADGGGLYSPAQVPAGNTNADLECDEFFALDMSRFDTDGDGLADIEEDANRNGVMDAGETGARVVDSDADGMPDGAEVFTGVDPLDSNSWFETAIRHRAPATNTPLRIEWQSLTNRLYTVLYTDALSPAGGAWQPAALDLPGTGTIMAFTETNAPAGGPRFYRVLAKER